MMLHNDNINYTRRRHRLIINYSIVNQTHVILNR